MEHPVNLQHIRAVLRQIDLSSQSLRTMLQNAIDQGVDAGGTVDVSPMTLDEIVALAVHMLVNDAIQTTFTPGEVQTVPFSFTATHGKGPTYE